MNRFRKALLSLLLLVTVTGLLLWALGWWFAPKMKDFAVGKINTYLAVPVSVDDIDFSFLRKFPHASISFQRVHAKGSRVGNGASPLLDAQEVFLIFSWWDILKDAPRLRSITLEGADICFFVDKDGKVNYDIFKKDKSADGDFTLEMEEIRLEDCHVRYLNRQSVRDYSLHTKQLKATGTFASKQYLLHAEGDVFVERMINNGVVYVQDKPTDLSVNLQVDASQGVFTFRDSRIQVREIDFDVNGFVRNDKRVYADLNIKSRDAGLRELFSLLPSTFAPKVAGYKYDGKVYFDVSLKGNIGHDESPLIEARFGARDAEVQPDGSEYSIGQLRFTGTYSNRGGKAGSTDRLQFTDMHGVLQGQPFQVQLLIEDFTSPFIRLNAQSKLDLAVLSRFYCPDTIESISGSVEANARIQGRSDDPRSWISAGRLVASDVEFKLKGSPVLYRSIKGKVKLSGNRLMLDEFSGMLAGSDFRLNGYADNAFAFFLDERQHIDCNVQLVSRNLDLNELLEDGNDRSDEDTTYRLDFNPRLNLRCGLDIGMLTFRKFGAWQLKGTLDLRDRVLQGQQITFKAFEGSLTLNGRMDATRKDSVLIACDADLKRLDVTEVFTQLGNFGQEVLMDKNVKGKLTSTVQFISVWGKDLHCDFNTIYARSKVLIEKGELIDFEPLLALSRYLRSADLKHIRFETLENVIEISNQMITLPSMEIKSSVMDLTASGTHSFSNVVDYKLQLYLSQLIGRKVKAANQEFGTIEDDGLGRMRLFLSMKGPLNNPKVSYDRKGIEKKISEGIRNEKQDLKVILRNEFGWSRKDSTLLKKPDPKTEKQQELQLDTDEE